MLSRQDKSSSICSWEGFLCSSRLKMALSLTPCIILVVNSELEKQLKSVMMSKSSWKVEIFSSDSSARSIASSSSIPSSSSSSWASCSSAALFLASRASYCSILILIRVARRIFSVSCPWSKVTGGSGSSLVFVLVSRSLFKTSLLFTLERTLS